MHEPGISMEVPLGAPQAIQPVLRQPGSARPATSYLDGLRGIAAVLVYTYHYSMALEGKRLQHGYGLQNSSLISLPVIRLVKHSGPAMVSIFFAISGYVLSVGPLRYARWRQWDKLLVYLSGAALTRPLRLLLPSVLLTLASLVLTWFGFYEQAAREICSHSSVASAVTSSSPQRCDFYPVKPRHFTSLSAQIGDWFGFVTRELANPWNWEAGLRPASAYGLHLWTIGAELRCSMVLFAILAALGPCTRPLGRASLLLASLVFCALWKRWDMVAFLAGLGLAAGDIKDNEIETQQDDAGCLEGGTWRHVSVPGLDEAGPMITIARRIMPPASLFASLWLCSYPDADGHQAWGFGILSSISSDRYLWHTAGAVLMLWSTRRIRPIRHFLSSFALVQFLGKISFALYLVHEPLLQVWGWPLARSWSAAPWPITVLVFVIETCALLCLSSVVWVTVDQPVIHVVKMMREYLV